MFWDSKGFFFSDINFVFFLGTYIGCRTLLSLTLPYCHKASETMVLIYYLCSFLCWCGCWLLLPTHTPIPLSQTAFYFICSLACISLFGEFCSATLRCESQTPSVSIFISLSLMFFLFNKQQFLAFVNEQYISLVFVFPGCFKVNSKKRRTFYCSVLKRKFPLFDFWNALLNFILIFTYLTLLLGCVSKFLCPERIE